MNQVPVGPKADATRLAEIKVCEETRSEKKKRMVEKERQKARKTAEANGNAARVTRSASGTAIGQGSQPSAPQSSTTALSGESGTSTGTGTDTGTDTESTMASIGSEPKKKRAKRHHLTDAQKEDILRKLELGIPYKDILAEYPIAQSTISGLRRRFNQRGTVARKAHNGGRPRKLSEEQVKECARFLLLNPRATLAMAAAELKRKHDITIAEPTIGKSVKGKYALLQSDFIHVPSQRNTPEAINARAAWVESAMPIEHHLRDALWIDESHFYLENARRKGWGVTGFMPVLPSRVGADIRSATLYAAVCPNLGLVHHKVVIGACGATAFLAFLTELRQIVVEKGYHERKRLVIFDNASEHSTDDFFESLITKQANMEKHWFPMHSPFLTPIEEVFSIWTSRQLRRLVQGNEDSARSEDLAARVASVANEITPELVSSCFLHTKKFWVPCIRRQVITSESIIDACHEGDDR